MCNLYSMTRAPEAVRRLFRVGHNRAVPIEPRDAIFPGQSAPVVRLGPDGGRELVAMSWGFVLPQAGKAPRRITQFRDDRTLSSSFWRDSFETRRCLLPATSFAEPKDETPATWHWFALAPAGAAAAGEAEARPLFAFAAIWRLWKGPLKKDGPSAELVTCAIMTTAANALVASVDHDRMPVLLTDDRAFDTWLHATPKEAFSLARTHPPEAMRIVQSGFEKRDLAVPAG